MLTTEFALDLPRHDYMRLKLKNLLKPFFLVTLKVNNIFVQQVKKTKTPQTREQVFLINLTYTDLVLNLDLV